MTKQLWVIDYESIRWCGGQSHCLVWAEDADQAEDQAADFMQDHMLELFSDEDRDLIDEEDDDEFDIEGLGPAYTVNNIQLLAGSDYEQHVADPVQQHEFYPYVN